MNEDDHLEAQYEERYDDPSLEDETSDELLALDDEAFLEDEDPMQPVLGSDPNPLGVDIDEAAKVYGGDGHGSADARQLVVFIPLADRSALTFKERVIVLDADVRDAMAHAARRLDAEAMKYSNQGFTWSLDDIEYGHAARRMLSATLRIARNGA